MITQYVRGVEIRCALIAMAASLSLAVAVLPSSSALAQADKFDGEWLAKGELNCVPKGYDSFEAVIKILNSQLSGKLIGGARDYEITGTIDSAGKLSTRHLLAPLLGYNPVLRAVGRFSADQGKISYTAAGAAGAPCGGDMILTRTPSKTFEEAPVERDVIEDVSPSTDEFVRRLRSLKDLENSGLISSDEAAQKRAEILKDL